MPRLSTHVHPQVHFNDPGRADWEGLATDSAAIAAGGTHRRGRGTAVWARGPRAARGRLDRSLSERIR